LLLSHPQLSTRYDAQTLYVLSEFAVPAEAQKGRLPLNLCLVIDRSTSMQGERLAHVKEAAYHIIDDLEDQDSLAVVAFDDRAEVILPGQTGLNHNRAKARVSAIVARGGTEILRGLKAGLTALRRRHSDDVTSHLILLTDGRTYGDAEGCIRAGRAAGAAGIGITTMGIGEDWNEDLLEQVAAHSGGRSVYIQTPEKVLDALHEIMQGLTGTFAQNLRLGVDCAAGVSLENAFRVSPHLQDFPSADEGILLGALRADVPVTVVLELNVGHKPEGEHHLLTLSLTMDVPARHLQGYVLRRGVSSVFKPIDLEDAVVPRRIINALGKFTLYRIQERAWHALDRGDFQMATDQLKVVSTRLFDLGEKDLARATLLEAERIANGAAPLAKQRKAIRYGTRSLAITSGGGVQPETFYD
jgi:uncharacterized protein YegL